MSGNHYFLDTNIVVPFLNGDKSIVKKVDQLPGVHLPIIVLGELRYDAMKSARHGENLEKIRSFVLEGEVYPVGEETTESYEAIKLALVRQGTPIPENDIWIVSLAKEYDLPVVTRDKHFKHIPGIEIIEW